ncbi:hypothetical protein ACWGCW_00740 [Streptomyces sp. NPDC054933]
MPEATETARKALLEFALAAFKECPNPMVEAHAGKLVGAVEEAAVADVVAERDELATRIESVRALHQPVKRPWETICKTCSGYDGFRCRGLVTQWPCPTLQAIDGELLGGA